MLTIHKFIAALVLGAALAATPSAAALRTGGAESDIIKRDAHAQPSSDALLGVKRTGGGEDGDVLRFRRTGGNDDGAPL